ncbi:major capsid protein [Salinarimonas rosea]|uniref:major capsid protein n=1 Tax=Salinarimonas rosea TaxID=552063 RepID=UPI00041C8B66|nr:major capsid protein [Salinarimonas rosea]
MSIYSTHAIMRAVESLKRPKTFLLDTAFPYVVRREEENISFDIKKGNRKVAPFVAQGAPAKNIRLDGYRTRTFTPPRIALITDLNPRAAVVRMAGERIGGDMPVQQRAQAVLAQAIVDTADPLVRRQEVMAADALVNGSIVVAGDGIANPITIDFDRHPDLMVVYSGTDRWNDPASTAKPLEEIEAMASLVHKIEAALITDIVVDPETWKILRQDEQVKALLDLRRAVGGNSADVGPQSYVNGAVMVGQLGQFRFWVYQEFRDTITVNADGTFTVTEGEPLLAPGTVLGIGPNVEGTRLFGAILDQEAVESGNVASELFMNSWLERNPGRRVLSAQSAPLPVPVRSNATFSMKVFG